ncbi:MAG: DMT family transporter [Lentisphaeria bacterium]|nr:DMT family transporter [Lentisphaeria bacterium]
MTVFILIFVSCILHILWNISGKKCRDNEAFTWLTTFGGAVFCIIAMVISRLITKNPFPPTGFFTMAAASGFFETTYFIFLFWSYKHIDMSASYPLGRGMAPVITLFLVPLSSMIFDIQEHSNLRIEQLPAVITTLTGAVLICRDSWLRSTQKQNAVKGLTLACLTGLSIAGYHLVDSQTLQKYTQVTEIEYLGFVFIFMLLFASIWFFPKKNAISRIKAEWKSCHMGVLSVSFVAQANYMIVLYAFSIAKNPTLVTAARNMGIVLSLVVCAIRLKEKITPMKAIGAVFITAGIIWIFLV